MLGYSKGFAWKNGIIAFSDNFSLFELGYENLLSNITSFFLFNFLSAF